MNFATSQLASFLADQHKSKEETGDFELSCQGKVVRAHSFILMRSEFFKTAMNTAVGHSDKTMEVNEFSHKVLTVAVDFMYGKEIPEDFNLEEDLMSLLQMADLYLMDDLKDAAGFLIGKTLSLENIFDISKFADKFRATLLREQCAEFLFDSHTSFGEDKIAQMNDGSVIALLAVKMMKDPEGKKGLKDGWMTKLFGDQPAFKSRKDFAVLDAYKTYLRSMIKSRMFVKCSMTSVWHGCRCGYGYGCHCGGDYIVTEGHVGFIRDTYIHLNGGCLVKWLTVKSGDQAFGLLTQSSSGPIECLDLLTEPFYF